MKQREIWSEKNCSIWSKSLVTLCLVSRKVEPCLGSNLLWPDVELQELLPANQDCCKMEIMIDVVYDEMLMIILIKMMLMVSVWSWVYTQRSRWRRRCSVQMRLQSLRAGRLLHPSTRADFTFDGEFNYLRGRQWSKVHHVEVTKYTIDQMTNSEESQREDNKVRTKATDVTNQYSGAEMWLNLHPGVNGRQRV